MKFHYNEILVLQWICGMWRVVVPMVYRWSAFIAHGSVPEHFFPLISKIELCAIFQGQESHALLTLGLLYMLISVEMNLLPLSFVTGETTPSLRWIMPPTQLYDSQYLTNKGLVPLHSPLYGSSMRKEGSSSSYSFWCNLCANLSYRASRFMPLQMQC